MTSERARRTLIAVATAIALAAASPAARAQSPEELKQARELFQEAYKDEQEKRFDQALEKFRRVAKVKESASVRYRIGSVLESLGHLREARDAFRALAASKASLPANEHDVADSAAARAHELDKKIPRLSVRVDEKWPADTRVTVDGGLVPVSPGAPRSIEVDPGEHVVAATGGNAKPYEAKVNVAAGGETSHVIPPPASGDVGPVTPPGETQATEPNRTLGYVLLAAGGVLLVTGGVMLIAREGEVGNIEDKCPGNVCPTATRADVESSRDTAETLGPLGVGVGIAGLAAAGVGAYLVLRKGSTSSTPPASDRDATPASPSGSLRIGPRAVRGGAVFGLQGSF